MALTDYSRAIELDPNLAQAYFNRGDTYYRLHRYKVALVDLNRVIELDPNFAQAYFNRGNTYARLQQYEAALADYSRAIELELDPNFAQAHYNLGVSLYKQGRQGDALPYLKKQSTWNVTSKPNCNKNQARTWLI